MVREAPFAQGHKVLGAALALRAGKSAWGHTILLHEWFGATLLVSETAIQQAR